MALKAGDTLGKYEIDSQIGVGGMGEVFLAHDPSLERKVAVKILGEEFGENPERLARFVREARAASALNHPNILTIFEITKDEGINYIVSEYVEGETLKSRMKRIRASVSEGLDIAIQAASALASAHDAGIIHRDIKPANIMVRHDGIVKVVDFGIAKLIQPNFDPDVHGEAPTLSKIGTAPGMMIGTPRYMSPEQARGKSVDNRSDIFSLGLVLFELFTGKRAFDGESTVDVISSILKDEAPTLQSVDPQLPKQLNRVIAKCLRKEIAHRYHDIRDLLIDLEDLKDELRLERKIGKGERTVAEEVHFTDADAAATTGSLTAGIVKTRRFTLLHALAFVAAAVVVGGAYFWYDSYSHPSTAFSEDAKTEEIASWSSGPGEILATARFSPDGKLIAFASTRSGTKDIWVKQVNSTEAIQITKDERSNTDPVWSPDGSEIAYISDRGTEGAGAEPRTGIWRVSALGGAPRAVGAFGDGTARLTRWTPDGDLIFFASGELHAMGVTDGKIRKLTDLAGKGGVAEWADISDDSALIAYVYAKSGKWTLATSRPDGEDEEIRFTSDERISDVVWLPVDGTFFFSRPVEGVEQIFGLSEGAAEPARLTNSPTGAVIADAARDGDSLIYSSVREESNVWRVKTDGSGETPFARSVSSELWPAVSGDGKRVAFLSARNLDRGNKLMAASVTVKPSEGADEAEEGLTVAENGTLPVWSPGGDRVAFLRVEEGGYSLFVVNSSGGGERRIATGAVPVSYSISPYNRAQSSDLEWLPDGSGVVFVYGKGDDWRVRFAPVADGAEVRNITKNIPGETQYCPVVSPEGDRVAFYAQTKSVGASGKPVRSIWVADLKSGEQRKILGTEDLVRLVGWDSEGTGLVLARTSKFSSLPPETALVRIDALSGLESEIARLQNAYYYNIFLSHDRSKIAFAARKDGLDDLWLIPSSGGTPAKLTGNNDSETYFSALAWAPDAGTVYFGKQTRFSLLSMITNLKK